jgi:ABC-2 type transport system ATP-binding protein
VDKEGKRLSILTVKYLTKHYSVFILQDVSFYLAKGRIMGLIGRNGAGKTTTLKSILNLVRPDNGKIEMFGYDFMEFEIATAYKISSKRFDLVDL